MDPHSSYLSPRQSEEYRIQMSLSYDGIGASLQLEDDYVKVINIIPGGPAQIDGQTELVLQVAGVEWRLVGGQQRGLDQALGARDRVEAAFAG